MAQQYAIARARLRAVGYGPDVQTWDFVRFLDRAQVPRLPFVRDTTIGVRVIRRWPGAQRPATRLTRLHGLGRPAIGRDRGPLRGGSIRAMAAAPTDLLAGVGLFSELSKRELKDVAGSMQELRCSAGREVVAAGKRGAAFFIITEGKAAVIRAGKEVATLGPGDYFGEVALVTGGERNASVTALTDLVLDAQRLGLPFDRQGECLDRLEAPRADGSSHRARLNALTGTSVASRSGSQRGRRTTTSRDPGAS